MNAEAKLTIDPTTLKVHEIEPMIVKTTEHDVKRSRHEDTPIDF